MVRNASLTHMNYLRQKRVAKKAELRTARRNMQVSLVLYFTSGQNVYLNSALLFAIKKRRLKRKLGRLRHPNSFRRIFPDYKRLSFASFDDVVFRDKFRLPKSLCIKIRNYLQRFRGFGQAIRIYYGLKFYTFGIEELLLIYWRRLAIPDRVVDVAVEFGRCMPEVSQATSWMCLQINAIAKEFLDGRASLWWTAATAQYNADCVNAFDVPLRDVCMFLDGTHQKISNPWKARVQALYYSGYIRATSNKIVAAMCPQGLYVVASGVAQGRRHDMAVAALSNLYPKLVRKTQFAQFQGKVYGDTAFRRRVPVFTPFNPSNTDRKRLWNKKMSSVRISVEWSFRLVRAIWPSNSYAGRHKIMQGNKGNLPGKNFYNCIWLTNLFSCHQGGNLISDYFDAEMPTLERYLGIPPHSLD